MYPDPDRKRRFGKLDWAIVALIGAAIAYIWHRVSDVLVYKWSWSFLPQVLVRYDEQLGFFVPNTLLEGLMTTLRLSIWAMLLACILGLTLGILGSRKRLLPRLTSFAYVGLIRNIPPLVFVFVFYFFISSQIVPALGIDSWSRNLGETGQSFVNLLLGPPELFENLLSGVFCLAMFEAAYIAEIVRAGIASVPEGQHEGAQSLGLNRRQTFGLVILPQALKSVTPALANQFIMLVKNSAIMSLISVQELTFMGTEIAVSTNRRFETWITVAVMYFGICFALSRLFAWLERRQRTTGGI